VPSAAPSTRYCRPRRTPTAVVIAWLVAPCPESPERQIAHDPAASQFARDHRHSIFYAQTAFAANRTSKNVTA
jgi:hypothetical protein